MPKNSNDTVSVNIRAFNHGVDIVLKMKPLRNIYASAINGVKPAKRTHGQVLRSSLYDQKESA